MADNSTQNVNLILRNEEQHEDEIVISFSAVFRKLKKYFLAWMLTAIIIGGIIAGASVFFDTTSITPVRAVVSFTYSGIEKGKNPDGTDFHESTLKNPTVIERALAECGQDINLLESVRQGMEIEGQIPQDTYNRLTTYKDILENATSGQLSTAQAMFDETWFSTEYKVTFNYKNTGLSRSDAVQVLNATLNCYRDWFFERYGYNEALGNALAAMDYTDYDYAEAVDMFTTSLTTLNSYVSGLSKEDTARFRSTVTGYTFADLQSSINMVQRLDLDLISSYLNVNNITKDKERLQNYYEYRIETLQRQQKVNEETLAATKSAFESYEKDQIMIFSDGTTNTQSTVASSAYDDLLVAQIDATNALSNTKQQISYYNDRLTTLRKTNTGSGSEEKVKHIEAELKKVNEKVNNLIQLVNDTADDYYQNVSFSNAYNILLPATSSVATTITSGISKAIIPIIGVEAILLMLYLAVSFIQALIEENRKKKFASAFAAAAAENVQPSEKETENKEKE